MIGAVDIGGTKIAVGMVNGDGRVLTRAQVPTNAEAGYRKAVDAVIQMLREAEKQTGAKITGIGIGSTGPVYPLTGAIGDVNFFPNWNGENPVQDLARAFEVGVAIENDADAAALGEAGWGAGRNKSRLIYVTVGTGIGVGLIFDGKVYRGVDYSHPEIGHHLIDPSGPSCYCGFHGCWESLATGPAMESWMAANVPSDYPHGSHLSAKRICELARSGDAFALKAVAREAHYLSLGLANLVTLYVPDSIVLGGSVMNSADLFLDTIHKTIAASCHFVPYERTEIALASLGEDANLIGAARVWYHKFAATGEGHAR
ncbi:MAG TPA: ROK family protein [Verrucomicrobiae bacterium]|nr:ROK family protein [Verrucomicrobiae bacterium]